MRKPKADAASVEMPVSKLQDGDSGTTSTISAPSFSVQRGSSLSRSAKTCGLCKNQTRRKIHDFLDHPDSSPGASIYNHLMTLLVVMSYGGAVLETLRVANLDSAPYTLGNISPNVYLIFFWACMSLIFLDILLRFLVSERWFTPCSFHHRSHATSFSFQSSKRDRVPFFLDIWNIVDIAALMISICGGGSFAGAVRIFRLAKHWPQLQILMRVMYDASRSLLFSVLMLLSIAVVFSSLLLVSESCYNTSCQFPSLDQALYFSLITITTVGFGDQVPVTIAGRFIAIILMLLGTFYLALPLTAIGHKFERAWNDYEQAQLGKDKDKMWKQIMSKENRLRRVEHQHSALLRAYQVLDCINSCGESYRGMLKNPSPVAKRTLKYSLERLLMRAGQLCGHLLQSYRIAKPQRPKIAIRERIPALRQTFTLHKNETTRTYELRKKNFSELSSSSIDAGGYSVVANDVQLSIDTREVRERESFFQSVENFQSSQKSMAASPLKARRSRLEVVLEAPLEETEETDRDVTEAHERKPEGGEKNAQSEIYIDEHTAIEDTSDVVDTAIENFQVGAGHGGGAKCDDGNVALHGDGKTDEGQLRESMLNQLDHVEIGGFDENQHPDAGGSTDEDRELDSILHAVSFDGLPSIAVQDSVGAQSIFSTDAQTPDGLSLAGVFWQAREFKRQHHGRRKIMSIAVGRKMLRRQSTTMRGTCETLADAISGCQCNRIVKKLCKSSRHSRIANVKRSMWIAESLESSDCRAKLLLLLDVPESSKAALYVRFIRIALTAASLLLLFFQTSPMCNQYGPQTKTCQEVVAGYCNEVRSCKGEHKSWCQRSFSVLTYDDAVTANRGCFANRSIGYGGCNSADDCDFPKPEIGMTCDKQEQNGFTPFDEDWLVRLGRSPATSTKFICHRLQCDKRLEKAGSDEGQLFFILELVLVFIFSGEIIVRLVAYSAPSGPTMKEFFWDWTNYVDMGAVLVGIIEICAATIYRGEAWFSTFGYWGAHGTDVAVFRALRLVITFRFVLQQRHFPDTAVILKTFAQAWKKLIVPLVFFFVIAMILGGLLALVETGSLWRCEDWKAISKESCQLCYGPPAYSQPVFHWLARLFDTTIPEWKVDISDPWLGHPEWYNGTCRYLTWSYTGGAAGGPGAEWGLHRPTIQDAVDGVWVIIVTMTTVGYGQKTPISPGGKLVVSCTAILGSLYLVMPLSIINLRFEANFYKHEYLQRKRQKQALLKQRGQSQLSIYVIVRLKLWAKRAKQRLTGHTTAHDTVSVVREILSYIHSLYYVSHRSLLPTSSILFNYSGSQN